jgi:hypothetical protein
MPGGRLGHVGGDISCEIRTHDLGLDLIQQGPPAAPDGECDEQGEQEGCDKLGISCRQADQGRLKGELQDVSAFAVGHARKAKGLLLARG